MGFCFLYQENPTTALPMKASIAFMFFLRCCLGQQQSPWAALGALHVVIDRAEFEEAQVPSSLLGRAWRKELLKLTDIGKPMWCFWWIYMNLVGDTNVSDFLSSWAAKGKVDHRHEIQKLKRSKALILQYEADEAGVHFLDFCKMPPGSPGWHLTSSDCLKSRTELNQCRCRWCSTSLSWIEKASQAVKASNLKWSNMVKLIEAQWKWGIPWYTPIPSTGKSSFSPLQMATIGGYWGYTTF